MKKETSLIIMHKRMARQPALSLSSSNNNVNILHEKTTTCVSPSGMWTQTLIYFLALTLLSSAVRSAHFLSIIYLPWFSFAHFFSILSIASV